jgi:glycolate oxidase FAD binding subunit
LGGDQLIEWGGALRWLVAGDRTDAQKVRTWAAAQGGHATIFRAANKDRQVFHPQSEPLVALHRRLKSVFDPRGILNPGRLMAEF